MVPLELTENGTGARQLLMKISGWCFAGSIWMLGMFTGGLSAAIPRDRDPN